MTKQFFIKSYYRIVCIFDDYYYCDYYSGYNRREKYNGYIVFNKPKYLPGDTVKLKAFVVTAKGNPVDKPVLALLDNSSKRIPLVKLNPYRAGGFEYQFYLHDSLQLKLDRTYSIILSKKGGKDYISGDFKYEDYELSKTKLEIRTDKSEQYKGQAIKLFAKGTDENDLNLMDARLEVTVKSLSANRYFDKQVFIPDTLLFIEKPLKPTNETEVSIPDSLFPKANFDYDLTVRLLTSDNEAITQTAQVNYYYNHNKFDIELLTDSIRFKYLANGLSTNRQVKITAGDYFGNSNPIFEGETPCTVELNHYFATYKISADSLSKTIRIGDEPSQLQCYSERTADSIFIMVDNPRKIPFTYNIYKRTKQKASGFANSLNLKQKASNKQNYFLTVRYLWGGRVMEEDYRIPLVDNKLNIAVSQPMMVYPGQKSSIELKVTDYRGNPVEGVDLTAYSITKKFKHTPLPIPYFGKERKNKELINNFRFDENRRKKPVDKPLDYSKWEAMASIDTIEYYKFLYPGNEIYRFNYYAPEGITQFAPFVVSNGEFLPIHIIYVDSKPVYFRWTSHNRPYSFTIDSGYHQVKLRTSFKQITIDSLYYESAKKSILSINDVVYNKYVKIEEMKPALLPFEQQLVQKYIMPFRSNFGEKFAFVEHNGGIHLLSKPPKSNNFINQIGPVAGSLTFNLIDGYTTNFDFEPYFEYEFNPNLIKMRSFDKSKFIKTLYDTKNDRSLADFVLTKKSINEQWDNYIENKRKLSARYRYPVKTTKGQGRILLGIDQIDNSSKEEPLNILVFRYDNHEFLRVYPGSTTQVHELTEGYHRLLFFYSGARYHTLDSIYVKPNGLTYIKVEKPKQLNHDSFSEQITNLIEENLFKPLPHIGQIEREVKQIFNEYQQQYTYTGEGNYVDGFVYDSDGEPIPGASVVVKGTSFGTATNVDGYYSIKVPSNRTTLIFSFIGFKLQEVGVSGQNVVNVNMEAEAMHLEEVVVVGYGVSRKSMTAASYVTSQQDLYMEQEGNFFALEGKIAGVSISPYNGITGGGVNISIRGATTATFDKTPLYVINGSIFMGDISELDPAQIKSINVLKDAQATAIYGSKGANGVVIIETVSGTFKPISSKSKGADFDATFLEAAMESSSIRNNFSDYAFWKPKLITDAEGKARFDVKFPDDVTSWETFYIAMNGKRQSGNVSKLIKSYKPIMAQLVTPRFLLSTDKTSAIGKALNYTPDSLKLTTRFELNGEQQFSKERYCENSLIDTLAIEAKNDSLAVKYYLETPDGYFDGELRNIPVFPLGLEQTNGNFYVLDRDTSVKLNFEPSMGEVTIFARADVLDVLDDEISNIASYKYSCNEQIASKLKATLAKKSILTFKGQKFKGDNEIEKFIRLLEKNRNENGLWGWWKNSEESKWISLHALEALTQAEKNGYKININKRGVSERLVWEIENSKDFYTKLRVLKILRLLDSPVDFKKYVSELEKTKDISLNGLLQITELKQQCKLQYQIDTLKNFKKHTLFGNIYYAGNSEISNLLNNDIQNTIIAYRILSNDSTICKDTLVKIRNFFFERRRTGYWRNTYESAQIIETILPDLLGDKSVLVKPTLTFSGDISKSVSSFPFEIKCQPNQKLEVSKTGSFPIYLTSYQRFWNTSPSISKGDFEVTTRFEGESSATFKAGQEATLVANVVVSKDAEFVLINIPIPAGFSYADKKNNYRYESHREYFRNETSIFCERLAKGNYTFEIKLIARYTGQYSLNPAKIELMYFPTFNANNEIKLINVKK
jgi:TonB-dependent SusC/RagA subfamily outer membrane receptor